MTSLDSIDIYDQSRQHIKNRVEREMGEGIRMGNTCKSMGDSCYCIKILIFQDRTVCPIFGAQSPNPLPPSYSSREKEQNELSLK